MGNSTHRNPLRYHPTHPEKTGTTPCRSTEAPSTKKASCLCLLGGELGFCCRKDVLSGNKTTSRNLAASSPCRTPCYKHLLKVPVLQESTGDLGASWDSSSGCFGSCISEASSTGLQLFKICLFLLDHFPKTEGKQHPKYWAGLLGQDQVTNTDCFQDIYAFR